MAVLSWALTLVELVLVSGSQFFIVCDPYLPPFVRISNADRSIRSYLQSLWFPPVPPLKPMGPSQSINDPNRPLYITLHKKIPRPTKIPQDRHIKLKKILYNFENGNIQYLI